MSSRPYVRPIAVGFSIALHAALVAAARRVPSGVARHHAPILISFDVAPAPPPTAVPPPEPVRRDPPPAPRPSPAPEARAKPVTEQPDPPPEPQGGVGLATNGASDGESWLAPVGDGVNFGPARTTVVERVAARSNAPAPVVRPRPPTVVAASDLSERLRPPALDGALERAYPPQARQRGIGGTAVVRARIGPDGAVRSVVIVTESFPGFGAACQKTLTGSVWSAPRDRNGRAVTTEIRYTCRFVVGSR